MSFMPGDTVTLGGDSCLNGNPAIVIWDLPKVGVYTVSCPIANDQTLVRSMLPHEQVYSR